MKRNLRKTAARKPREQPTGLIIAGGRGALVKRETTENKMRASRRTKLK